MHYGLYRGITTKTNDPEGKYRIRAKVPTLLGEKETDWAWPCVPPGWDQHLLQEHEDHEFTDDNDGDNSSGSHTEILEHTKNHLLWRQVPNPGEGVWIMFESGDIEKPVWMGVWV